MDNSFNLADLDCRYKYFTEFLFKMIRLLYTFIERERCIRPPTKNLSIMKTGLSITIILLSYTVAGTDFQAGSQTWEAGLGSKELVR